MAADEPSQWGILAETSSESDDASNQLPCIHPQTNLPKKITPILKHTEEIPTLKASLVPLREKRSVFATRTETGRPFPARMLFYKERGSAHSEKAFHSNLSQPHNCTWPIVYNIAVMQSSEALSHSSEELSQEEPIQCCNQLEEEFDKLTKLFNRLKEVPESHPQFQVTLLRFLKTQKRIFDYKLTLDAQVEGKQYKLSL